MLLTCRMLAIPPVVRGYHDACLVAGRGIACSGRAGPRRPPLSPASKGTAVAAAAAFAPVFAGFVIHVSLVLTNPGRQSFDLATVLQASKLFLRNMESTSLCSESSVFSVQVPPPPPGANPGLILTAPEACRLAILCVHFSSPVCHVSAARRVDRHCRLFSGFRPLALPEMTWIGADVESGGAHTEAGRQAAYGQRHAVCDAPVSQRRATAARTVGAVQQQLQRVHGAQPQVLEGTFPDFSSLLQADTPHTPHAEAHTGFQGICPAHSPAEFATELTDRIFRWMCCSKWGVWCLNSSCASMAR